MRGPGSEVGGVFSAIVVDHFAPTVQLEVAAIEEECLEPCLRALHLDFAPETLMPSSAAGSLWVMPSYSVR